MCNLLFAYLNGAGSFTTLKLICILMITNSLKCLFLEEKNYSYKYNCYKKAPIKL